MITPLVPTILFVPGAWIGRSVYEPFVNALTQIGYDVRYTGYPSLNPPNPAITDVKADTIGDPHIIQLGDVNSELASELVRGILPHSTIAFTSPQPHPAWADEELHGLLAFIVTAEDKAVPKEAQYDMMNATGKPWIVKEMDSSHCAPFLDRIDNCVGLAGNY